MTTEMRFNYKRLALIFFMSAILLRMLLCLVNPPNNAFDNHFEPISLIMQNGTIPDRDACWECYQPPVFYGLSAMIGDLATYIGANDAQVMKLLQFTCCLYGIFTVFIIYLILNEFNLSDLSKLLAFGLICFLPRHIYMSAMLSNDTLSYLFISLCAFILIKGVETNFPPISLLILTIVTIITIFTKYTSFIVIAMILTVFVLYLLNLPTAERKKKAIIFCLSLFIPLSILSFSIFCNVKNYGKALPANYEIFENSIDSQPRDNDGISFLSFKPWESVKTPILVPGKLNSFWTIIYSGMWFDTEPKYLYFMDSNTLWWKHYYDWLNGVDNYPGDNPSMSKVTIFEGSGLITLGLFPLLLFIIGGYRYLAGLRKI